MHGMHRLDHETLSEIVVECERHLASFQMVPDMFSLLTSRVDERHFERT